MALLHTLTDTFATQDAAKWTYSSGTSATGGQCSLIPDATFTRQVTSAAQTYDVNASYALVEVASLGSSQILSMIVNTTSADTLNIYYEFGSLKFRERVSAVDDDTSITHNGTTHRWWCIQVSGGSVYWRTSSDGATWVTQRSKALAITNSTLCEVAFMAYTASGSSPAQLDNFNLPVSAPTITSAVNSGFFGMM